MGQTAFVAVKTGDTITAATTNALAANTADHETRFTPLLPGTGLHPLTGKYHAVGYPNIDETGAMPATAGLNALFAAAPAGSTISLFPGMYLVDGPLTQPRNDVTVEGIGGGVNFLYSPAAAGTMWTLTAAARVKFVGVKFTLAATTAGAGSTLINLAASYRVSFTRCIFQGQHTAAGDAYGVQTGHIGLAITANTGDTTIYDTDFLNLGVGIITDSIQNAVIGGKFGTCWVGVWGTSNIGGETQGAAGMSLSGYVDFVSSPTAGLVHRNLLVDTTSAQWWLSKCWFEGADVAVEIGTDAGLGPSQFAMSQCKVAAQLGCIQLRSAGQTHLDDVQFNQSGASATPPVTLYINPNVHGGVSTSLRSLVTADPLITGTGAYKDFLPTVFPVGWIHHGNTTQLLASTVYSNGVTMVPTGTGVVAQKFAAITGQTVDQLEFFDSAGVKRTWIDQYGLLHVGNGSAALGVAGNGQTSINPGGMAGLYTSTYDSTLLLGPRTAASNALRIKAQAAQTSQLLQVTDNGDKVVSGFDAAGRFLTGVGTPGFPTVAVGAGAGSGATVTVTGNDQAGTITVVTGTGTALGSLAVLTFATPYAGVPTAVGLTALTGPSFAAGAYLNRDANTLTVVTANAPAVSTTLQYSYRVTG